VLPGSASTRSRSLASSTRATRALLHYLKPIVEGDGGPPMHLHEEAREIGWTDEQLLEAIAYVALESFTAMINIAGDVPIDGSVEESRTLRAA
jgi:alkylhydroperoxidase family enzyme